MSKETKTSGPLSHKEIMAVLSGLMMGMLLAALDQTIVSTALKTIVIDLHGLNHYTWVVTAYLLTSTASTPLYGKISDLYGRRPVFQFAIVTFLIGSFAAGAAQTMDQLVIFRAIQGLGAGGLMSLTSLLEISSRLANAVAIKVILERSGESLPLPAHCSVDSSLTMPRF